MTLETPLLTTEQRKRLITRDEKKESELEAYKKRHNDQVVLKKLGDFIESIPDVLLILEHMPQEKIAKKLRPAQVPAMLELVETLLQRIDPWPVAEHEQELWAFKTVAERLKNSPDECYIKTTSWPANNEEIAINQRLKDHIMALQHYIDPYLVDPVCREPGDFVPPEEEMIKAIREGTRSTITSYNYIRPKQGKNGYEQITVKKDELKFKHWNPKDLPVKYEVPEQREEPPT